MKHLQRLYYRLQVRFLDFHQVILFKLVTNGFIADWEYNAEFGEYLQKKAVLNKRIQKIGGAA